MLKSTYVLDVESAEALDRLARDWQMSKSAVLRRVIKSAAASPRPGRQDLLRQMQKAAGLSPTAADRWVAATRAERRASSPEGRKSRP